MATRLPAVSFRSVGTAAICVLVSCALVSAARQASINGQIEQPNVALVHFMLGAVACIGCAILSLRAVGWWGRVTMAAAGVLAMWFAVFLGTVTHFDVWQAMPNPPSEAYADGSQLIACVVVGWIPGVLLYGCVLAAAWGVRRLWMGGPH